MFDARTYWNERLKGNFDLVGVGDISQTANYNKWSYRVTEKILRRLFRKYLAQKKNKSVLDIGSGTGFIINIWSRFTRDITGIDIAEVAVRNLRELYPDFKFYECTVGSEKLPFDDNQFACCSAASVMYHIVEDDALKNTFSEIYRVLEPDGIFVFSDNFIHSGRLSVTHQRCRSLEEYENLVREAGFVIEKRLPNYILFNDPVDSHNRIIKKLWAVNTRLSRKYKWYDNMIWPVLYPAEMLLTSLVKESPAQEFMICRAVKQVR